MQQQMLKINGIEYCIYTWGDASLPKLFLLHGWMDSGASFQFIAEILQEHYYCIAPDWRGFGKSEATPNELGYFFYEYVADLHELLAILAPGESVMALGHSMGGMALSYYAGTYPSQISHLINVEGFGIKHSQPELGPVKMREWIEAKNKFKSQTYPSLKVFAERLQKANPRLTAERAAFLVQHLGKQLPDGTFVSAGDIRHKWVSPYLFNLDYAVAFWQNIQAKCLLIYGEHTEIFNWLGENETQGLSEMHRRMDLFPANSQRTMIHNCGHRIHHEQPKALAHAVLKFIL